MSGELNTSDAFALSLFVDFKFLIIFTQTPRKFDYLRGVLPRCTQHTL